MSSKQKNVRRLAVIGAGNMGSGIAQKMAAEGFPVVLVDLDDEKVARGLASIRATLAEGVERRVFRPEQAEQIESRVRGSAEWSALADVDLVVEAVFEDLGVKKEVFGRLEEHCRPDTILATNTSSFAVTEVAEEARHPERILGLHYFYHPAKNRLVEVVPGERTAPETVEAAWFLQEQIGKTPISSADASGFVVNRYFVPWLNEAVRLLEEGVADIATIEWACKKTFRVGMGPFELMNVTGVPIALHAATTLGERFGPLYAPVETLRLQVESGGLWNLDGQPDESKLETIANRMLGLIFFIAASLVEENVGSVEDTDIGARVGLRWPLGPFELMNRRGLERSAAIAGEIARRWNVELPALLARQAAGGQPFRFELVRSKVRDGIAHITINRPDALNALNETVVGQLHDAFRKAASDPAVRGIVIGGAGKAFVAGADLRFFVKHIEAGDLERIAAFTRSGHELQHDIESCDKPVIARLHGLALGGGLELALACHKIVATPKATVAFPETGIGIYPGLGGTQRTPRRIGRGLTRWLIFTGQTLPATEAHAIGLIDAVVPYDELDATIAGAIDGADLPAADGAARAAFDGIARLFAGHTPDELHEGRVDPGDDEKLAKMVKRVGHKAPIALRLAGRMIDAAEASSLEEGLQMELDHLVEIFGTADAYEGLSSLGRKRPEFQDR